MDSEFECSSTVDDLLEVAWIIKNFSSFIKNHKCITSPAKWYVVDHNCKDANTFQNLIDQEITMLAKDINQIKLNFLRKRILGAFLQFAKIFYNCTCTSVKGTESIELYDYEFREPLEKKNIFCISCRRLLPYSKFPPTAKKQLTQKCKGCVRFLRNLRTHVDLRPYENILNDVRQKEGPNSLADYFSIYDTYHLVLDIWHGRSALSEHMDQYELRLPPYELSKPWSPWNCIVLTHEEAEMHRCLGGGTKIYSDHLHRKIRSAHHTARMDFRLDK